MNKIRISTKKDHLDVNFIHAFLTTSYWAKGRTLDEVKKSIQHSLCFGVFYQDKQIGFARVVSDHTIFAYLMDVFIDPDYRGNGYAKLLMEKILQHPELSSVKKFFLQTNDAHKLYVQFGFEPLASPEKMMLREL